MHSLPSTQGWTYLANLNGVPEPRVFSLGANELEQHSLGIGFASGSNVYARNVNIDPGFPMILVVRARLTAWEEEPDPATSNPPIHGFDLVLWKGGQEFELAIAPHQLHGGLGGNALSSDFDATQFHTYTMVVTGSQAMVLVDGQVAGSVEADRSAGYNITAIWFGDGTGGSNANVDIASLCYSQILSACPSDGVIKFY